MRLGDRHVDLTVRALVVGLLGFGGDEELLCRQAEQFVADGADVVEVGPRDGADSEWLGLDGVVDLLQRRLDVPLAVTTGAASVARACLGVGAVMVRDPSGFADPALVDAVAEAGATVVAVHSGSAPAPVGHADAVVAWLTVKAREAELAGVAPDRIILDAGRQVWRTPTLAALAYPVLITALAPAAAEAALGVALGGRVVRTPDVVGARRACDVIAAIMAVEPASTDDPAVVGAVR